MNDTATIAALSTLGIFVVLLISLITDKGVG